MRLNKYHFMCFVHFMCVVLVLYVLRIIGPSICISIFDNISHAIICIFLSVYTFEFTKRRFLTERISPDGKAVLITGCSSGFGYSLSKHLDDRGFRVFATCRNTHCKGAEDLRASCSKRMEIIKLDVTNDETISEAVQSVTSKLGDSEILWAIVNNAGITKGLFTDFAPLQDFKDTMDTNCFGTIRVTKAFLPLLKKSVGRVINMTSIYARQATPFNVAYTTSKFATAGFSETLKLELDAWGIRVIQIEPDLFETPLSDPQHVKEKFESEFINSTNNSLEEYGEKYFHKMGKFVENLMGNYASSSSYAVTNDLDLAISSKYPDKVYRPCRNDFIRICCYLIDIIPLNTLDLIKKIIFELLSMPRPRMLKLKNEKKLL